MVRVGREGWLYGCRQGPARDVPRADRAFASDRLSGPPLRAIHAQRGCLIPLRKSPRSVKLIVTTADRPLSAHHPLGASTGFSERSRGNWDQLLLEALETSTFAAELAALSEPEFHGLLDFLGRGTRFPFLYLSVHAPVKQREVSETTLVDWLCALPPMVESVVVHPDTLREPRNYLALGRRLIVENMDDRKAYGRTAEDLGALFSEMPEAGFCFDIAHAWSIDPSMRLANELLDLFGDRLRQVHLSSLHDGKHVPVLPEHELLFAPLLDRCRDVPWILEAKAPARWQRSAAAWLARAHDAVVA